MGKAAKKHANRMGKQIQSNKENEDFIKMIEAMEPDKSYRLKLKNTYLFNGQSLPGAYWKQSFLKPKTETDGKGETT